MFRSLGSAGVYLALRACAGAFVLSNVLGVCAASAHVLPVTPALRDATLPVMDRVAQSEISSEHIPGLVILVENHGTVDVGAYGLRDVASRNAMTDDYQFEIGSTTKQFTAVCILQLVEAGKLSLDDPLSNFIPSYKVAALVTVRQLLGQVSGIPEYLDGPRILVESGSHASQK